MITIHKIAGPNYSLNELIFGCYLYNAEDFIARGNKIILHISEVDNEITIKLFKEFAPYIQLIHDYDDYDLDALGFDTHTNSIGNELLKRGMPYPSDIYRLLTLMKYSQEEPDSYHVYLDHDVYINKVDQFIDLAHSTCGRFIFVEGQYIGSAIIGDKYGELSAWLLCKYFNTEFIGQDYTDTIIIPQFLGEAICTEINENEEVKEIYIENIQCSIIRYPTFIPMGAHYENTAHNASIALQDSVLIHCYGNSIGSNNFYRMIGIGSIIDSGSLIASNSFFTALRSRTYPQLFIACDIYNAYDLLQWLHYFIGYMEFGFYSKVQFVFNYSAIYNTSCSDDILSLLRFCRYKVVYDVRKYTKEISLKGALLLTVNCTSYLTISKEVLDTNSVSYIFHRLLIFSLIRKAIDILDSDPSLDTIQLRDVIHNDIDIDSTFSNAGALDCTIERINN